MRRMLPEPVLVVRDGPRVRRYYSGAQLRAAMGGQRAGNASAERADRLADALARLLSEMGRDGSASQRAIAEARAALRE